MGIPERKRKEKEARVELIKKTARVFFNEKGYKATKMEDVAIAAEISKATIYQYFKSKDDLFYEMMKERFERLNQQVIMIHEKNDDPVRTLMLITETTFEFSLTDSEIYHVVTEMKSPEYRKLLSEDKARHLKEIMVSNLQQVELTIRDGIEKGIFRKVDPKVGSVILWNTFMGILKFQENRLDEGKKDHRKSTLFTGIEWLIDSLKKI